MKYLYKNKKYNFNYQKIFLNLYMILRKEKNKKVSDTLHGLFTDCVFIVRKNNLHIMESTFELMRDCDRFIELD